MGRTSSQRYPKHVEAILCLSDRIAQKEHTKMFTSTLLSGKFPWALESLITFLFHEFIKSICKWSRRGTWHGFFRAMTNHHNQSILVSTWCYSFMVFRVVNVVSACSSFHLLIVSGGPFPPQGRRPPFKTELPPPPKNDLESAPWRSGHVVPPRNKDAPQGIWIHPD